MTVTELAFRPGALPAPKKLWRPYEHVPEKLVEILDESYAKHGAYAVPLGQGGDDEVDELLRLARIYCRREGKTLQWYVEGAQVWLEMADKRHYTRRSAA